MFRNIKQFILGFIVVALCQAETTDQEQVQLAMSQFKGKALPGALLNKTSINYKNMPIETALINLMNDHQLNLSYNKSKLPLHHKVNVKLDNVYVLEGLLSILQNTGTQLMITKSGNLLLASHQGATSGRSGGINGSISGMVTDAISGDPLPGTNIYIVGTSIGAASDLNGKFQLSRVPPGMYTIRYSYIGYQSKDIEVRVLPREQKTQDVSLDYRAVTGETVVVSAQAEGQMQAINQQLTSNTIKNIVAADRIQELPDVNAAESIGRLPGISITRSGGEANKIVIRGLAPKYNTIMVNNVAVPSTDRQDRSVDLSMISSNLLSSIEVTKSLTPDMEANAIGGAVNLKLKEASENFHYDIKVQGGYNGLKSEYKNYQIAGSMSDRFFDNRIGLGLNFNRELVDRSSEQLRGNYEVVNAESKVRLNDFRLRRHNEDRARTGAGLVLDYQDAVNKYIFSSFYSRLDKEYVEYDDKYNIESKYHDYAVANNREFRTDMFNNAFQGENQFYLFTMEYGVSYIKTNRKEPDSRTWLFREENAYEPGFDQYSGVKGVLPYAKNDLENTYWMDSNFYQRTAEEDNLTTYMNFSIPYRMGNIISGHLKLGGKYRKKTRLNDEHHLSGSLGNNGDSTRRDLIAQSYLPDVVVIDMDHPWELLRVNNIENTGLNRSILNGDYQLHWVPELGYLNTAMDGLLRDDVPGDNTLSDPLWLGNVSEYAWDYDFWDQYDAYYVMSEINIGSRFMVLPGVRYERTKSRYIANVTIAPQVFELPNSSEIKNSRSNEYWFPQFQMRYKVNSWFDIRLAGTQSITRPDYRAISPYQFINSQKTSMQMGNPGLMPSLVENWDIFFSFYSNTIGLFTISGFYKEIEDLIYKNSWTTVKGDDPLPLAGEAAGVTVSTWINNPFEAYLKGMEIDLQTNFWYLPKPLNYIVLNANYTKIKSNTYYPYNYMDTVPITTFPFKKVTRVESKRPGRIIQQPNDIINIAVGYDYKGFSGRVSFLYQGNTIREIGNLEEDDVFTKDYTQINLSFKQSLPVKGLQIYCNVNNLTDEFDETYQYESGYFKEIEQYGRTADIGLRYQF